jgi:chromate transport protein ChrA
VLGYVLAGSGSLKGRSTLAGALGYLAAYSVFSKILPTALPAWLAFTLPAIAAALLFIEYLNRQHTSTSVG